MTTPPTLTAGTRSSRRVGAVALFAALAWSAPSLAQSSDDGGAGNEPTLDAAVGEGVADDDSIFLDPAITGAGEVIEIEDEAPDEDEPVGYEIDGEEVRTLPGSGNDALKALQSLPGVSRIPYGLGGLSLRGSSPRDTSVYLDGIRVPILYHFGGLSSFYPSAMLESVDLVPGGFGAAYGRSQGGLVSMSSLPGRSDRWRVASEVSLLDAQVRADGPDGNGGRWQIGLRRSYVDAILAAVYPGDSDLQLTLAPRYYDAQARYDIEVGDGHQLTAMVFGSDDRLSFLSLGDDGQRDNLDWIQSFVRAGLRYKKHIGRTDVTLLAWAGLDQSSLTVTDNYVTRRQLPMGGRADWFSIFGWGYLAGGLDLQGGRASYDVYNEPPPALGVERSAIQRNGDFWYTDLGLWTEGFYRVDGGRLGVKPGLRLDRFGMTGEWVLNPRLAVSHELPGVTLTETVGIYHQPPVPADLDPVSGNPELRSSHSWQATVGARVDRIAGLVDGSVTGFYEDVGDMAVDAVTSASPAVNTWQAGGIAGASTELLSEQFGYYAYQENNGRGRNYGVELLARHDREWLTSWVAYTYSRSLRRGDPRMDPFYHPFVLDQPHRLTALASARLGDAWRVGARLRYATGNPITPVAGAVYDPDAGEYVPIDGPILSQRLPAFFQLDLRVDRSWQRDWGTIALFLDVQNVTNRVNPEGVSYSDDYSRFDYTRGLPIFPSIGLEFRQ